MIWTLRRKIFVAYSIVLILMITIFLWALISLVILGRGILKNNYVSVLAADNMSAAIEKQNNAVFLIVLGYYNEGLKQFNDNGDIFLQWLGKAKNTITEEDEGDVIKDIGRGYSTYRDKFSTLRSIRQVDPQKSTRFYHETVLPLLQSVLDSCDKLHEINEKAMFEVSDRAQFITTKAVWFVIVIGIVTVGMGLGFSLFFSNSFVKQCRVGK